MVRPLCVFRFGVRALLVALACASLLGAGAEHAHARDFEEEGRVRDAEALLAKMEAARTAGEDATLATLLKQVPGHHNALGTKRTIGALQKFVGAVAKDAEAKASLRLAAVACIADLHDDKGAWKLLAPLLPKTRTETATQVELAVLDALRKVAPEAAIKPLVERARKGEDPEVVRRAILALGGYGYAKKRVSVLESLIDLIVRWRPGARSPRGNDRGRGARNRFDGVRDVLVEALNTLTGRREAGAEVWLARHKEFKGRLEALFRFER